MSFTLRESAPISTRLGHNGQLHETTARWQMLGNGYRAFNPVLMRFHSPDSLSPFQEGWINAYAYARLDPINLADPSGHFAAPIAWGALALTVGAAIGTAAAYFAGEKELGGVLLGVTAGLGAVTAMATAAHVIPKTLGPKAFGQQPSSIGKDLARGDMRLHELQGGVFVAEVHGQPGRVQLGRHMTGAKEVASRMREMAGAKPIKGVQLQACYSANAGPRGEPSFGQALSRELKVPVMGFRGKVDPVGKRLTYKVDHQRYFYPDGRSVTQIGPGQRNPWLAHKPQLERMVRELRSSRRR